MPKQLPSQNDPPRPDELELSLFGPGIGECLVVHLGYNDWMIVDSCLHEPNGRPVALHYLGEQLRVDVGTSVKLVVVTHWHDDHIRGISAVLREAADAQFACSAALGSEEFRTLIAAGSATHLVEHTSGVAEFAELLEIQRDRGSGRYAASRGPDQWVREGMRLFHRERQKETIEVWSLSPSSQTETDSKLELARLLPTPGTPSNPYPPLTPNSQSVVLRVDAPGMSFLLGGDLEVGADGTRGWRGVINSPNRGLVNGRAYKVAHHGAPNADHPHIWEHLLAPSPHAVLTPFARGKTPRPSQADINRLRQQSGWTHSTIWPLRWTPPRRRGVDATMNQVTRSRRAVRRRPGHVRIRAPFHGDVSDLAVALFDGAGTIPSVN